MKKMILAVLLFLTVSPSQAFDKKRLEGNLRQVLNLLQTMPIVVGDAAPSEFAGLLLSTVSINGNPYPVYVTTDDNHYFWGNVFDLRIQPDAARWARVDLKNVHAQGSAKAPVTMIEYTDMQCPHCQRAHSVLKDSLRKDFSEDQVRLVFKHFPLPSIHDWAEKAAFVSECAAQQKPNSFWAVTDFYFDNSKDITKDNFTEKTAGLLKTLAIDKAKVDACIATPAIQAKVKTNKDEGAGVGVTGTPSFLINGRLLRGSDYGDMKALIQEKLADAKK